MSGHEEEMEDLTPEQIAELAEGLSELRDELQETLAQARTEARPVDLGLEIGRITRVDALQQQQMAAARVRRIEARLAQVRAAEGRLASGTYGECVRCELPIGHARLRASPEAPFCTRCQSAC